MQDFRKLDVWQKAHQITLTLYRITRRFPSEERYGLTSQIRRASASVGANLAEGCCRRTDPDFARFVQIALGSAGELEYHLLLSADLEMLTPETHTPLQTSIVEIKRMLAGLSRKLRANS